MPSAVVSVWLHCEGDNRDVMMELGMICVLGLLHEGNGEYGPDPIEISRSLSSSDSVDGDVAPFFPDTP